MNLTPTPGGTTASRAARDTLAALAAAPFERHALHGPDSPWPEKNCYIDLWIELLQGLGLEVRAMLAPAVAVDLEGDQWTFLKPAFDELRRLYGLDVQELTLWRPVLDHLDDQLAQGRLVTLEVDAWWLPDTVATDYRRQHVKTTVAVVALDRTGRRLDYVHNAGRHTLGGEDFDGLFAQAEPDTQAGAGRTNLAPYAELVRLDRLERLDADALRARARPMLAAHAARRPDSSPLRRFAARWGAELPDLQAAGLAHYHRWAFSNLRQLGSAAELAGEAVGWAWPGQPDAQAAAAAFRQVAVLAQGLILKGARSVATGRALDIAAALQPGIDAWDEAQRRLDAALAA